MSISRCAREQLLKLICTGDLSATGSDTLARCSCAPPVSIRSVNLASSVLGSPGTDGEVRQSVRLNDETLVSLIRQHAAISPCERDASVSFDLN